MAVGFVFGRSGSGKTRHCIESIAQCLTDTSSSQPLILLVPEQASYQAERAILTSKNIGGYHRLHVLSFNRLQFFLMGKNTVSQPVTKIGQQMIIQKILREKSAELKIFRYSAEKTGFGREMAETIKELHRYDKGQEEMEELVRLLAKNESNNPARLKFADIGLVLSEYARFIEGKFTDPDIQLRQARDAVGKSEIIKGARVWVDGFSSFTTSELNVLLEIIKCAQSVQIAFCLDAEQIDVKNYDKTEPSAVSLFYPTEKTFSDILGILKKLKIPVSEPIVLREAKRFEKNSALEHIEKNIFKLNAAASKNSDGVKITACSNQRAEAQFVARRIAILVREKNMRYRDIAVVATDLDSYANYLKAYFEEYGLPYFIDKRKSLSHHPLISLLASAFAAVSNEFSGSDVFSFLKNDFGPLELKEDIDLLESYCTAFGIKGEDWTTQEAWRFDKDDGEYDEQNINKIKAKAIANLLELHKNLFKEKQLTCPEFTRAVFDFLDSLKVWPKLEAWIQEATAKGYFSTANEHLQFYDKFIGVFDEMNRIFEGHKLAAKEIIEIADSAFSQITLGFIPPTQDQVLIGSIERSRHPDIKAAFLIGTTQKEFPVPVGRQGLLSDDDRQAAMQYDFDIGSTTDQVMSERQYLAYIAFTRPSKYLYISYPMTDEKGQNYYRSQFVSELMELFADLKEETFAAGEKNAENILSKSEMTDLLCSRLGKDSRDDKDNADLLGLLGDIIADKELCEDGKIIASSIQYDNKAALNKDISERLYADTIYSSATRLGTFAACPYKYFARYILGLKEREEFKLEPLDVGNFYHKALDLLLKKYIKECKNFAQIPDAELAGDIDKILLHLVQSDMFIANFIKHSEHNKFIIASAADTLKNFALAMQKITKAGDFRPIATEISFGKSGQNNFEVKLSAHTMLISGFIDRIDTNSDSLILFDYKKGKKNFNWGDFYNGLDMQLVIYLLAADKYNNKKAVGAFYLPIEHKVTSVELTKLEKAEPKYKAYGIFSGQSYQNLDANVEGSSDYYNFSITKDGKFGNYAKAGILKQHDYDSVISYCKEKLVSLGNNIVSGDISIRPFRLGTSKACSNCDYRAVCRFDWQINEYNLLEPMDKKTFLGCGEEKDG